MGKKEQVPARALFVQGSLWVWSATSRGRPPDGGLALAVFHMVPRVPAAPNLFVHPPADLRNLGETSLGLSVFFLSSVPIAFQAHRLFGPGAAWAGPMWMGRRGRWGWAAVRLRVQPRAGVGEPCLHGLEPVRLLAPQGAASLHVFRQRSRNAHGGTGRSRLHVASDSKDHEANVRAQGEEQTSRGVRVFGVGGRGWAVGGVGGR